MKKVGDRDMPSVKVLRELNTKYEDAVSVLAGPR